MASCARLLAVLFVASGCLERGGDTPPEPPPPRGLSSPSESLATGVIHETPTGVADTGAEIRVRLEAEPSHLNPMIAGDGLAIRVALGDIYEGLLCRTNVFARPTECLAAGYSPSADERVWRFTVRSGVRFHDGSTLDAADVIASLEAVALGKALTPLTTELDDLVAVRAEGDVVIVEFRDRRLDRLGTFTRLPILPSEALATGDLADLVTRPISRAPVGTGPLRFVEWRRGESITLERNDDYWGKVNRAARIAYKIVGSRERAYVMARTGKLDVVPQLPIGEARDIAAMRDELDLYTYPSPSYLAAVYNARHPAMDTAAERRALTMLLDRRSIITAILGGQGAPISGPYIGDERDTSIEPLPFDRALAAKTLGSGTRLRILYPAESRTMARIADIWAADARGVVALEPTPSAYATVLERSRAGDFDIVLLAFTTGPELDMWPRMHSSQIGAENYGAISDPDLDGALDGVRSAVTRRGQAALARAAHHRISLAAPYAFIATDRRAGLVWRRIGGVMEGDGLAARLLWRERETP